MIIYATTPYRKHTAPSLSLSYSNFPTAPAIPAALEIKPANFAAATNTRRANQEASLGTALVAIRRRRNDWNFFRVNQQLGTRGHFPIAQDDKEDSGIS
jgi:hypothetical protein